EPAYFRHVTECARLMFEAEGTAPRDYAHVVFHQPNGKFPQRAGKQLGFTDTQMRYGLVTPYIGNTYSAASLIGLANVLDHARAGERVLVIGYGSGAGSDAFDVEITEAIDRFDRSYGAPVQQFLDPGVEIPYSV
ncbi:hydroxymethylglutaryl-CoA synthase, partial [mine drainage metagenome]